MDMLFTHFGISGPAALRCSQFIYHEQKSQKQQNIQMQIDAFPEINEEALKQKSRSSSNHNPISILKMHSKG